jgi:hypothetical protein
MAQARGQKYQDNGIQTTFSGVYWLNATEVPMFREVQGFKAQIAQLNLIVTSDFDEWRVVLHRPGIIVVGQRQFTEARAKEEALTMAKCYLREKLDEEPPEADLEWTPLKAGEWLSWHP